MNFFAITRLFIVSFFCVGVFSSTSSACLWDNDTLHMERERFPNAFELITGNFARHSPQYYQWRVEDRLARIKELDESEGEASLADLYNDLSVAYDKLGAFDNAIGTMQKKLADFPNEQLYESHANLGTHYIHAGELREGLEHIKRAIEINPDAHFGREIYQQLLVEYLLDQPQPLNLPLDKTELYAGPRGFAKFVLSRKPDLNDDQRREEIKKATKGILGMMRFGNHESPILLDSLACLLLADGYPDDNKRLAVRAYLRAASVAKTEDIRTSYVELAEATLQSQTKVQSNSEQEDLVTVQQRLAKEVDAGQALFRNITSDEERWIANGDDVDEEFKRKYLTTKIQFAKPSVATPTFRRVQQGFIFAGAVSAGILLFLVVTGRIRKTAK